MLLLLSYAAIKGVLRWGLFLLSSVSKRVLMFRVTSFRGIHYFSIFDHRVKLPIGVVAYPGWSEWTNCRPPFLGISPAGVSSVAPK